jgi:predicted nuclease of restriction endonuclease-like RecB superfamily
MARFLPGLLACSGWRLGARVQAPSGAEAWFILSHKDGYKSLLPPPPPYDSLLERQFAGAFGSIRKGWRLIREGEILFQGQHTFVPDFVLRHEEGCEVLFEIAGFWTGGYLDRKQETFRRFKQSRILFAFPEQRAREQFHFPKHTILYKTDIRPKAVLEALEKIRTN